MLCPATQVAEVVKQPIMEPQVVSREALLSSLPAERNSSGLAEDIRGRQARHELPILVVLDDDPTGTQTCHDINVLTVWDHDLLVSEFKTANGGFFILTNSRALHREDARVLISNICEAVKKAAAAAGKDFEVVLRGDSTLRGHFPDEPEVAEEVLGKVDGWVLAPFFRQGGRLTINDIHYVADADGNLVPAGQTPFAKDATFGYKSSNLRDYVVEKSKGSIPAGQVRSISIEDIRTGGANVVAEHLLSFDTKCVIIVNAVVDSDMETFVEGLLIGKKFCLSHIVYG